jgi:hypothetical protein
LLELPSVVDGAASVLKELNVTERCHLIGADFFKPLPLFEADVVFMKHILHDWSDEEAIAIAKNVRMRMKDGDRLVLFETVIQGPNVADFSKHLDLEIMVHADGRERTKEEFEHLLKQAGFRLNRVIPTASPMSVLEALPA